MLRIRAWVSTCFYCGSQVASAQPALLQTFGSWVSPSLLLDLDWALPMVGLMLGTWCPWLLRRQTAALICRSEVGTSASLHGTQTPEVACSHSTLQVLCSHKFGHHAGLVVQLLVSFQVPGAPQQTIMQVHTICRVTTHPCCLVLAVAGSCESFCVYVNNYVSV
jgi:hypothetical protein